MKCSISQKGNEIQITPSVDGDYENLNSVCREILIRDKTIVIGDISIMINGQFVPIPNALGMMREGIHGSEIFTEKLLNSSVEEAKVISEKLANTFKTDFIRS